MTATYLHPTFNGAGLNLAAPRYFLGVDGGGTGTRVRLTDAQGLLLGQGEAGPSALGQGIEQAWQHIQQAVLAAARQAGLASVEPAQAAIGLGLSGVSVKAQAQAFLAQQPGYLALALDGDGYTSLLGAHGGQPGAVVAVGTGSVGEALRRDGSRICSSGWGWICGDEGSGAWLGLQAMRQAQRALDGRGVAGALALAVWAAAGADRQSLLAFCAGAGQQGFAALAPLVFSHAELDPAAEALLVMAVQELEQLANSLDPAGNLPLALSGSIALRLAPRLSSRLLARRTEPQGDSAAGALLLIRQAFPGFL
jgi:glucosamine kinase